MAGHFPTVLHSRSECIEQFIIIVKLTRTQGLAESNQIFTGSIDGVDNMLVKNFDCCFLRQILTTVMLKIEKCGLRVLIWEEVQPLIDVLALP